jgi:S-adenosylmethionine decarboxylase
MEIGKHVIAEVYEVPEALTTDAGELERLLVDAAGTAGATVLHSYFHSFTPKDGHGVAGVTGVIALAESHISVHTWPEFGYMAIDVFMCGEADPVRVLEALSGAGLVTGHWQLISRPFANHLQGPAGG